MRTSFCYPSMRAFVLEGLLGRGMRMVVEHRCEGTRERLREAFLALMREKPFDSIRVVEVANLAGVSRKTFYGHYEDINDIAFDCYKTHLHGRSDFRIGECETPEALVDYVVGKFRQILNFCRDNVAFARLAFEGSVHSRYLRRIVGEASNVMAHSIEDIQPVENPVARLLNMQIDQVSRVYFIGTGLIVSDWIADGMEEDEDLVARKMAYLTFHLSDIYSAEDGSCAELKRLTLGLPRGENPDQDGWQEG